MRLIDADALLNMRFSNGLNEDGILYVPFGEVIRNIKNEPTAYDVEKVLKELRNTGFCNKCLNNHNSISGCAVFCDMGKRLEIVRNGGKE